MIHYVEAAGRSTISLAMADRMQGRPFTEYFNMGQHENDEIGTCYSRSGMRTGDSRDS
jgi:hypothetical protein